jgi:hypothetical protein
MVPLDGTSRQVEVAPGYRLAAQGLRGWAWARQGRQPGTRGGGVERATPALDDALRGGGLHEVKLIELDVQAVPPPPQERPLRTPAGQDGLVLEVPDLGETVEHVVLAVDEQGVVTWNLAEPRPSRPMAVRRGPSATKRFVIRRHIPPRPSAAEGAQRGLVGLVGRKLLKVLVYSTTDQLLGPVGERFAGAWEARHRPYLIRGFGPETYRRGSAPPVGGHSLRQFGRAPTLLFVHGTFSTSHGGFGGLPKATMAELYAAYQGRVLAFDHFTLSEDPERNVRWILDHIPDDVELDLDVVCHSRGGLVARVLAGESAGLRPGRLRVRRVVFVGAPNSGTVLADPDHLIDLLDRVTSILNLAPPGPSAVVTETLEAVITVVKVLGKGAVGGLPGLTAMRPAGAFLRHLDRRAAVDTEQYVITADFEPTGSLAGLVRMRVADQVMDQIFGATANDLIVPTSGVLPSGGASPPMSEQRVLRFAPVHGISHSHYFAQPDTSRKLAAWLMAAS